MLVLEINEDRWCKMYYSGESQVYLGAEVVSIIRDKLMFALEKVAGNNVFTYQGIEMFWVLSLSEKHATINAHYQAMDSIDIYIIEDGANMLPPLELKREHIEQWKLALGSI